MGYWLTDWETCRLTSRLNDYLVWFSIRRENYPVWRERSFKLKKKGPALLTSHKYLSQFALHLIRLNFSCGIPIVPVHRIWHGLSVKAGDCRTIECPLHVVGNHVITDSRCAVASGLLPNTKQRQNGCPAREQNAVFPRTVITNVFKKHIYTYHIQPKGNRKY